MATDPVANITEAVVQIALEMWKLLRSFERAIEDIPSEKQARRAAQQRYSQGRLDAILEDSGIRILTFDGQKFTANLPVTPLNADEIENSENAIVESTLEPTIIGRNSVLHTGKVMLLGDQNVSGD